MLFQTIGNSDIRSPRIVFGAWAIGGWLWGGTDESDAIEAIHAALDHGINAIDTAPVYGFGLSEELVARALEGKARDQVLIFTKYGLRWDAKEGKLHSAWEDEKGITTEIYRNGRKASIIHECEESLRRLKTDYIDLYQIHWADPTTPISETMEAVAKLKEQGKIRAIGVCNYSAEQVAEADLTTEVVSNQVPYSMVHRQIEEKEVPQALEKNKAILAYSPLQRGILTGKIKPEHRFAPGDNRPATRHYQPENIRRINAFLDQIRPIAQAHNATLAQLVIRWTLEQPGISHALVGARNAAQAGDNAQAAALDLSPEEWTQINQALDQVDLV